MRNTLGVVITYNPDIEVLKRNIKSFIDDVEQILLIDNCSGNINEIMLLGGDKVLITKNEVNLGIAKALNIGLEYAKKHQFHYILTMDQDSYFELNSFPILYKGFSSQNVAIVCPSLHDVASSNVDSVKQEFQSIFTTITSGCLCSVEALIMVGGFDDKMFIDYVDVEICLRLNLNNYQVLRSRMCTMYHHLGDSKVYKFAGIKFISTNHSPLRRFYYARNKIYLYKKYYVTFPLFVIKDFFSMAKTFLTIVVYEDRKIDKLKMMLTGIRDGIVKM